MEVLCDGVTNQSMTSLDYRHHHVHLCCSSSCGVYTEG